MRPVDLPNKTCHGCRYRATSLRDLIDHLQVEVVSWKRHYSDREKGLIEAEAEIEKLRAKYDGIKQAYLDEEAEVHRLEKELELRRKGAANGNRSLEQAEVEVERLRAALTTIRDASYSVERSPAFECARIAHQALEGSHDEDCTCAWCRNVL